jgi:ankyrin repeat protein
LQIAIVRGHLETTKVLLAKGANPEEKNANGESLLFSCLLLPIVHSAEMLENKQKIFILLLPLIKNPLKEKTASGDTVLHVMATYGYIQLIDNMLKEETKLAFMADNFGHYPVHAAILNGQHAAAKRLLAEKGVGELGDAKGRNALHYAAMHGDAEMLTICLNAHLPIDALTNEHQTPLILASIAQRPMAVQVLLDKGAQRAVQDYTHMNALDYALQSQAEEIIKILQTTTDGRQH